MSYGEDLKAYLDRELPAERMQEIERALAQDPALQNELAQLQAISARLQGAVAFEPRGYERLAGRLSKPPVKPWWLRPAPLLAAGVAVAAVVVLSSRLLETRAENAKMVASDVRSREMSNEGSSKDAADTVYSAAPTSLPPPMVGGLSNPGAGLMLLVKDVAEAHKKVEGIVASVKGRVEPPSTEAKASDRLPLRLFVPGKERADIETRLKKVGTLQPNASVTPGKDLEEDAPSIKARLEEELQKADQPEERKAMIRNRIKQIAETEAKLQRGDLVEINLTLVRGQETKD